MKRPHKYSKELLTRKCQQCNQEFNPPRREVNRGNGRFCSIPCASVGRAHPRWGNRITLTCAVCKNDFTRLAHRRKNSKSGIYFCSRRCKDIGQRLESNITAIHPPHYGQAGDLDASTYRSIAFRHHPAKCNRCGYDRYKSVLRVHHIDRDRSNRASSNLEVLCPTCHEEEHYLAGDGVYSGMKMVDLVGFAPTASPVQTGCSPE
jgi:HNH endonuclease